MQKPLKNLRSFKELRLLGELKIIVIINNKINRFNLNNVNFFDLFYKDKFIDIAFIIKYINKNIFFRDIYIFID